MNSRDSFRISISIGRGSRSAIVAQTANVNNMIAFKNVTATSDYTSRGRSQEFCSGGGVSANSVEDRGQR